MRIQKSAVWVRRAVALMASGMVAFAMFPQGVRADETDINFGVSDPTVTDDGAGGQSISWDLVTFGSYPQAEVITSEMLGESAAVPDELLMGEGFVVDDMLYETLAGEATWNGNETVLEDGERYRRIKKSQATQATAARSDSAYYWSDDNTWHYFQYQPVSWRVLDVDENEKKALLLSESLLDDQRFNTSGAACSWENSSMRSWLNGAFLKAAFTTAQQGEILLSKVENLPNLHSLLSAGKATGLAAADTTKSPDTNDRLFLLSEAEVYQSVTAETAGFIQKEAFADPARRAEASTYARAMGTAWNTGEEYYGKSAWGLRSPGSNPSRAAAVSGTGQVLIDGVSVAEKTQGVRPAMWISLTAEEPSWEYSNTVSVERTAEEQSNTEDPTESTEDPTEKESEKTDTEGKETEKSGGSGGNESDTETEKSNTGNGAGKGSSSGIGETDTGGNSGGSSAGGTANTNIGENSGGSSVSGEAETSTESTNDTKSDSGKSDNSNKSDKAGEMDVDQIIHQEPSINKVTEIAVSGESDELTAKRKMKLSAQVFPVSATCRTLKWSSSNNKYATVSQKGLVKAKAAGIDQTVTITAASVDGSGIVGTYSIQIKRDRTTRIKLSLKKRSGNKYYIKADIYGTGSTVSKKLKWTTGNKRYATVTAKGVIRIKKAGKGHKVRITARATDGTGVKGSIKLRIR